MKRKTIDELRAEIAEETRRYQAWFIDNVGVRLGAMTKAKIWEREIERKQDALDKAIALAESSQPKPEGDKA